MFMRFYFTVNRSKYPFIITIDQRADSFESDQITRKYFMYSGCDWFWLTIHTMRPALFYLSSHPAAAQNTKKKALHAVDTELC